MPDPSPHAHWSAYDEALEMACWEAIHRTVSETGAAPGIESDPVTRLIGLSRSAGYGDADSFVSEHGVEADEAESGEAAALREQFDAYQNGDYWNCIDRSQGALSDLAKSLAPGQADLARSIAGIADAQRDAYEEGRASRIGMEAASPAP